MNTAELIAEYVRLRDQQRRKQDRINRLSDVGLRRYCLRPRTRSADERTSRRQRSAANQVLTQWRTR